MIWPSAEVKDDHDEYKRLGSRTLYNGRYETYRGRVEEKRAGHDKFMSSLSQDQHMVLAPLAKEAAIYDDSQPFFNRFGE